MLDRLARKRSTVFYLGYLTGWLVTLVCVRLSEVSPDPSGLACPSTHRWGHECTFPKGHRSPHLCECGREWPI